MTFKVFVLRSIYTVVLNNSVLVLPVLHYWLACHVVTVGSGLPVLYLGGALNGVSGEEGQVLGLKRILVSVFWKQCSDTNRIKGKLHFQTSIKELLQDISTYLIFHIKFLYKIPILEFIKQEFGC